MLHPGLLVAVYGHIYLHDTRMPLQYLKWPRETSHPRICPTCPYYYLICSYWARFYADSTVFSKAGLNAALPFACLLIRIPSSTDCETFLYNSIMKLPNVRLYVSRGNCTVLGVLRWNRNWQNAHCKPVQLPWKQCWLWETEGIVYMNGNLNNATVRH